MASSAAYGSVFRHTLIIRVFAFGQFSVCNLPSSSLIFSRIGENKPSPFEKGQFSIRSQFSTALRKPHLFSTPSGKGIERSGTSGRLLPFKETLLGFNLARFSQSRAPFSFRENDKTPVLFSTDNPDRKPSFTPHRTESGGD